MSTDLTDPIFHDEEKARDWLEQSRWNGEPVCPHCGSPDVTRMEGQKHRAGLFNCRACYEQFSVTVGTVMERSHIPLPKWVLAFHLLTASKKGISSHQLSRMLDVTYKTAWFLSHRIRDAMTGKNPPPLGGPGKVIEADEMYHGKRETRRPRRKDLPPPTKRGLGGPAMKREILGLVERGGEGRMIHMDRITAKNIREKVLKLADRKSKLHTDESNLYNSLGYEFRIHEAVNHGKKKSTRAAKVRIW
jgi:transposase-like protein